MMINQKQKQMLTTLATALRASAPIISTFFRTVHKPSSLSCKPLDNGVSLDTLKGWDSLKVEDVTQFVEMGIFNREQRTSRSGGSFTLDSDFVRMIDANDFQFTGARHRRFVALNSGFYHDLSQAEHRAILELAQREGCLPVDLIRAALKQYVANR